MSPRARRTTSLPIMQHTPQDTDPNWLVSQKPILLSELFCCRGNLYLNMQRLLNDTEPSAVDKESISDVLSPGRLKNMLGFFFTFMDSSGLQEAQNRRTDGMTKKETVPDRLQKPPLLKGQNYSIPLQCDALFNVHCEVRLRHFTDV